MPFTFYIGPESSPMMLLNEGNWKEWAITTYFAIGAILGLRFKKSLPKRYPCPPSSWDEYIAVWGNRRTYKYMGWLGFALFLCAWPGCIFWARENNL